MDETLKSRGIYDLIQLSRVSLLYCQNMLFATLYFWESSTTTFQLPRRMVISTLFDVASTTGLHPTGDSFKPNKRDENTIIFNTSCSSFGKYIEYHHDTDTEVMSDEEHIAFLVLWLSRCIFCCKSLKVAKRYLTLENQLDEGRDICISQLILGSIYESLRLATWTLKKLQPKHNMLLYGPYWLLQLWLNAMFDLS